MKNELLLFVFLSTALVLHGVEAMSGFLLSFLPSKTAIVPVRPVDPFGLRGDSSMHI